MLKTDVPLLVSFWEAIRGEDEGHLLFESYKFLVFNSLIFILWGWLLLGFLKRHGCLLVSLSRIDLRRGLERDGGDRRWNLLESWCYYLPWWHFGLGRLLKHWSLEDLLWFGFGLGNHRLENCRLFQRRKWLCNLLLSTRRLCCIIITLAYLACVAHRRLLLPHEAFSLPLSLEPSRLTRHWLLLDDPVSMRLQGWSRSLRNLRRLNLLEWNSRWCLPLMHPCRLNALWPPHIVRDRLGLLLLLRFDGLIMQRSRSRLSFFLSPFFILLSLKKFIKMGVRVEFLITFDISVEVLVKLHSCFILFLKILHTGSRSRRSLLLWRFGPLRWRVIGFKISRQVISNNVSHVKFLTLLKIWFCFYNWFDSKSMFSFKLVVKLLNVNHGVRFRHIRLDALILWLVLMLGMGWAHGLGWLEFLDFLPWQVDSLVQKVGHSRIYVFRFFCWHWRRRDGLWAAVCLLHRCWSVVVDQDGLWFVRPVPCSVVGCGLHLVFFISGQIWT